MPKLTHTLKRSNSIAISPDGKLIASANGTQINLFNATTYEQIAQFKELPNSFVSFSQTGKWLLAKTADRKLGLYDIKSLKLLTKFALKKITQHQNEGICFSPDDSQLINLVFGNDMLGFISVWDTNAWTEQRYHEGDNNVFTHIQYCSKKRKHFISGYRRPAGKIKTNRSFYLWFDSKTGESEATESDFSNNQIFVHASRKNLTFTYRPHSKEGKIHFPSDGKTTSIATDDFIGGLILSHDETKAAVMYNKQAILYTFPDFKKLAALDTLESFGPLCFSPDDKQLLIGTWKNGFIYDISDLK